MFDLRKRHSMILNVSSHKTEEFRRAALRRRSRGAVEVEDLQHHLHQASHTVSSGASGSYRHSRAALDHGSLQKRALHNGSPLDPQVSPKPAGLQTPEKDLTPTASPVAQHKCLTRRGKQTHSQGTQVAVLIQVIPAWCPITSNSPAGPGSSSVGSGGVHPTSASPVRRSDWTTLLRTPSPAVRGAHNGSPLRGGGGPGEPSAPASLSPRRDVTHKEAKRRTPSPSLWRPRSHSLFRRSRSWVSQRRAAHRGMDELARHSSVVIQSVVHMDGSSPTGVDTSERSPLKPLLSANCTTGTSKSPVCKRIYCTTSATVSSLDSQSLSTDPPPGPVAPGPEQRAAASPEPTHHGVEAQEASGEGGSRSTSEKDMKEGRTHDVEKEEEVGQRDNGGQGGLKRKEKLYKIAKELLMTERAYVARLHLLYQVFCSRLSEEASRGLFPVDVVKNIFSNISSIHSFHSQFLLPDLEERILHWWDRPGLGDILLHHAPFLRMYAEYVGNFEQAMGLLRTWRERSAAFRTLLQDIQSQEVCGSLGLEHHMLEPVQRVPRYEMLLKNYLRILPEEDPDHPLAHKALEAISKAAGHSNSAIHRAASLKKLLEIFEMVGEEEILNPSSEFLREGRMLKLAARNTSAMDRYLFLFNNFLLCCTPKLSLMGQRYGVRTRIGVEGMQVQKTANEEHPHSFQISGKEKTLELEASSEKDRDEWIKVIQEAIDVFLVKNESFKLASKEFDMSVLEEELGRWAPRWIRDKEVVECMKCQEAFNAITRRRHHCRACGSVVCWKCSDHKVALEYDGNRLNKVCKACYRVLSGREPTDTKERSHDMVKLVMAPSGGVMSSFLTYGDNPRACRRVWSIVPQRQPMMLHLYSTQQELSPLSSIPLLGSSVEESPRLSADPWQFCLVHATSRHTFICDSLLLKQRWLAALQKAGTTDANLLVSGLSGGSCSDVTTTGDQPEMK